MKRGQKKFNVKRLYIGPEKPATRRRTLGRNQHWRPLIDRCWTNKSNPEEINKNHAAKMDADDRSHIAKAEKNLFDKVTFTHLCTKGFACFPSACHLAILWKVLKHSKNIWKSKTTLSPIIIRVENGCIWKLTTIGGTHSSLPCLVGGFNPTEEYARQIGSWNPKVWGKHKPPPKNNISKTVTIKKTWLWRKQ